MTAIAMLRSTAMPARMDGAPEGTRALRTRLGPQQICDACGTIKGLYEGESYAQADDARFCTECWRHLTVAQIARVVREVELRGVPLS